MANMIEGTLKLRGTRDNIKKFMSNGLGVIAIYDGKKALSDFLIKWTGILGNLFPR